MTYSTTVGLVSATFYTYTITHIPTGRRYYGSSYGKYADPKKLGVTYFSSSRVIRDIINNEGLSVLVFQVRRLFKDPVVCRNFEALLLRRIRAAQRSDWLNLSNGNGHFLCTGHTEETRRVMSTARKGKILSPEARQAISKGMKGKSRPVWDSENKSHRMKERVLSGDWVSPTQGKFGPDNPLYGQQRTPEFCNAQRVRNSGPNNPNFGLRASKETREKMSKSRLGEKNWAFGKVRTQEHRDALSASLREGFAQGRTNSAKGKKGENSYMYGRVWVHSDTSTKRVYEQEVSAYLQNGWKRGRPYAKRIKKLSPQEPSSPQE